MQRQKAVGFAAAVALHAGLVAIALRCEPTHAAAALIVSEVELAPPAPPPELEPAKPPAAPEPEKAPEPARVHHRAPAPPKEAPPAAAGALHTAKEDAQPSASEPVRFAVDANGAGYGFGVVAAGGTGTGRGGNGPSAPATTDGNAPSAAPVPRAFAVPPRLDESDPCRGYFPSKASADRGEVTVKLLISEQGEVRRVSVLSEEPIGQGFGRAAQECLKKKRFVPARDASDRATAAEAPVNVRFSR
jgi:TonB family protein